MTGSEPEKKKRKKSGAEFRAQRRRQEMTASSGTSKSILDYFR